MRNPADACCMPPADKKSSQRFTPYQTFVAASLAFLPFAVILDFMIVAPLGALVMPALGMSARDFGLIVSAYAFSAGASGLLVAGFAGRVWVDDDASLWQRPRRAGVLDDHGVK